MWVRDTQSGLRAYTAPTIESVHGGWEIGDGCGQAPRSFIGLTSTASSFGRIGTSITYDVEHGSTESAVTHGLSMVHNIVGSRERIHPITLLAIPGLVAVIVGVVFEVWSIRLSTGDDLWVLVAFIAALSNSAGGLIVVLAVLFHVLDIYPFLYKGSLTLLSTISPVFVRKRCERTDVRNVETDSIRFTAEYHGSPEPVVFHVTSALSTQQKLNSPFKHFPSWMARLRRQHQQRCIRTGHHRSRFP